MTDSHPRARRRHAALLASLLAVLPAAGVIVTPGPASGSPTNGLEESQLVLLREASQVLHSVGERLWEGWARAPRATLVVDHDREYLVGLPERTFRPTGFRRTRQQFMGQPVYSRPAMLPQTLRTTVTLDGLPVAVVGAWRPDEEAPTEWVLTLIEQWFHVLQLVRGEQGKVADLNLAAAELPSWQVDYPFPYDDPDVGNAMMLLGEALYEFWSGGAQMPRREQREFLAGTAWAALQNLRTVITLKHGENAYRYFQMEVWRGGVARYSGILVGRELARAELMRRYRSSRGFEDLPEHKSYAQTWEENLRSRFWMIRSSGRDGQRTRGSFMALGHGLAELLDAIHPDWKERYFEPGVWLDDLIAEQMGPPDDDR